MDQGDSYIPMVMFMRENGKMIELMEKDNILIKMGLNMLGNGLMMINTEKVKRLGLMVLSIKVHMLKVENMEEGTFNGKMVQNM